MNSVAGEGSGGTQGEVEWELTVLSSKNNFIFNRNPLERGKKRLSILHVLYLSL